MTISTQAPALQRIVVLRPVRQNLVFAQQRRQDRTIPFRLAAVSYLRICCSALQTYQRLGLEETLATNPETSYLRLLGQLLKQHPEWWKLCCVSEHGYLISADHHIRELLHPLNDFVVKILEAPPIP
jgi:hypothetical protein